MVPTEPLWKKFGLPRQMWGLAWTDLSADTTAGRALVDTWLLRAPEPDEDVENRSLIGRGMCIVGPARSGKTTLACAIAQEVRRTHGGVRGSIHYTTADAYVRRVLARQSARGQHAEEDALPDLNRQVGLAHLCRLLVLDDFGQERTTSTGFGQDELYALIRKRNAAGRPTLVACTSQVLAALDTRFGDGTMDFLLDVSDLVMVERHGAR